MSSRHARIEGTAVHPGVIGLLRKAIRGRQYKVRTEDAYVAWANRFMRFHQGAHPRELGRKDVDASSATWPSSAA